MSSLRNKWREVSLGEICEFKYGKSLPASKRIAGNYPVYGSNGAVGQHNQALTAGPTVVIGRKGSLGEVHYSHTPCWPIDTTYYVDSSSTGEDLRWLSYRLAALGLKKLNRAAAVPGLNREDAYRKRLLVPPLEEQRRIAEVLDRADELRAKRRQALAHLDDLTQSIFLDMFGDPNTNPKGWPILKIGEILSSANYGSSQKAGHDGDLPVLRMNNITSTGSLDLSDLKYLSSKTVSDRHRVQSGDVLFNRTNSAELVGKTAIYRDHAPMAYAGYLIRLRVKESAHPEYLAAFLNSNHAKRLLRNMCKAIIGMANINAKELQRIAIPVPPVSLQGEFAERVGVIVRARGTQQAQLAELDALFASLQDRAFRGLL